MDDGFEKGYSDNLPKIDGLVVHYFVNNTDFLAAQMRGVKIQKYNKSARNSDGDDAIRYVKVKREVLNPNRKMDNNKDTVIVHREGSINIVKFNRPNKKNATDMDMYIKVTKIFKEASEDDSTLLVVTGTGDFYSSGNDMVSATKNNRLFNVIKDYVEAFINFPKLLIAIVNGPAIGIAATTLGLCDLVFAVENSYFYTPFIKLGFVAEGCSSFTFPRILGPKKANEMLLCNHKMTAKEALQYGFINYIYKPEDIQNKVWDKINEISKLPQEPISITKKLMRSVFHEELLKTNKKEIEELNKMWPQKQDISKL